MVDRLVVSSIRLAFKVATPEKITVIVEGTTYNHGRPEGISEDQHPMNQFLGMLRAGPPIRTQIYGIIPRGSSLPTSPDPAP